MNEGAIIDKIIFFLEEVGLKVIFRDIDAECFLPGLLIEKGAVIIDHAKLKYPGDIVHEAAHLAVVPAAERATLNGNEIGMRADKGAEEMMAIAWSYAVCHFLNIDPYFVFHESGYNGGGKNIADDFKEGRYVGVPMLEWVGMAAEKRKARELNISPYPAMICWLRH